MSYEGKVFQSVPGGSVGDFLENQGKDNEICECLCHSVSLYEHGGGCCKTCTHCGKERIRVEFISSHEENCPKNPKNQE